MKVLFMIDSIFIADLAAELRIRQTDILNT